MKKVLNYIKQHELIAKGDHVVIGISGGADSVCLLFLLDEISRILDFSIGAVHVNHNLRGTEAKRDEAFARELCVRLSVPFEVYDYDVSGLARERKVSIEEAGRLARYEAFEMYCKKNGGTKIALAHHQNDLAETMIYHLARGTDLTGLSAIRPARGKYIRPLLCMNRREIEHYLNERNIEYVTDSTNEEDAYTRNKIRHHVMDYLEKEINVQAAAHMAETSESLGEIQDFLKELYQEKYEQYVKSQNMGIFIKKELFAERKILVNGVLRMALERLAGSLKDIGRIHIEKIYGLSVAQVGKKIALPYGMTAKREYEGIFLGNADAGRRTLEKSSLEIQELCIPGETRFGEYHISCSWETESLKEIPQKTYTKWLDYDKINGGLVIRYRRSGDYLMINVQGEKAGRKKLKEYFINEKVPQTERDGIPLVCCKDHVAWICGHRISEQYKVDENSKKIVKIQIQGGKCDE